MGEPSQSPSISSDAIIGEVAPHHGREMAVLIADRPVPVFPAPVTHRCQRTSKAAFGRDLHHHVFSSARPSPHEGQAEKVEVGAIRLRMPCALRPSRAKVDEARSVSPYRPSRLPRTARTRWASTMLSNAIIAIVSIAGNGAAPTQPRPHLGLKPFIQHIVQKNVREAGRDYASLRGSFCRSAQETIFEILRSA